MKRWYVSLHCLSCGCPSAFLRPTAVPYPEFQSGTGLVCAVQLPARRYDLVMQLLIFLNELEP